MDDDYLDWDIPEEREEDIHICEDESCSHKGIACILPGDYNEQTKEFGEDIIEYLCHEHAKDAGYCPSCGTFIAGTGIEYTNSGYCDICWDEIKSNDYEDYEDYEDDEDDEDYYDY